jgi:hypothetical protein
MNTTKAVNMKPCSQSNSTCIKNLFRSGTGKGGIANVELLFALVFEIGDAAPEIKKASAAPLETLKPISLSPPPDLRKTY